MISGNPMLRAYDPTSYAQQAITFLCLDFNGKSTRFNEFPAQNCPSGIRAQINFPMCWDGVNADSPDHKSHVAFPSGGPDSGTCSDPKFPKTLPRIFMEMYLDTGSWWGLRDQAKNSSQPFVYSMGDPTGYGYHADFMMGWQPNVLQRVVDECHCNEFGDPTCCSNAGIFNFVKGGNCRITKGVNEVTTGVLATLPGNNPVVGYGGKVQLLAAAVVPALIDPVYAYTGDSPSSTGNPVGNPVTLASPPVSTAAQASSSGGAEKSAPVNPAGQAGSSSSGASSNPAQGASSASSSSSNSTSNSGSNSGSSASAGSPANPAGAPHSGSPPASPASPASGSAPSSGSASPSTSTSASPARVSRLSCLAKQNGTHARRARRAHDSRRKYNAGL
ncbi:unnamed protein product [Mycena citricolor]|nr:unnamed protein product [Mycena citricolor]